MQIFLFCSWLKVGVASFAYGNIFLITENKYKEHLKNKENRLESCASELKFVVHQLSIFIFMRIGPCLLIDYS